MIHRGHSLQLKDLTCSSCNFCILNLELWSIVTIGIILINNAVLCKPWLIIEQILLCRFNFSSLRFNLGHNRSLYFISTSFIRQIFESIAGKSTLLMDNLELWEVDFVSLVLKNLFCLWPDHRINTYIWIMRIPWHLAPGIIFLGSQVFFGSVFSHGDLEDPKALCCWFNVLVNLNEG